ncbi:MAG: tetratricopeptide repeat protein, partial [Anaerolineae bacterium]
LQDADAALRIEASAKAYLLRAEVLREMEQYEQALLAFDEALALDPGLSEELFPSRWAAARKAGDQQRLIALSNVYATAHPADPVRHYYLAWVPFQNDSHLQSINMLRRGIALAQDQPAVLWYLLGRSYTGIEAWREAILSLETARDLLERGDESMLAHTDVPMGELAVALGRAYLGDYRCTDAAAMLAHGMSLGAPMSEHLDALERARACPTPTPTVPPWATPTAE